MNNFEDIILNLKKFWKKKNILIIEPYDMEMGACTFHPQTFFSAIGPEPYSMCSIQPCRRPTDGRYGENPNRLQRYYQFQVIIKPSPKNIQELYLKSLESIGIDIYQHDIRFVYDDWKSPTLGAWGLGWEVWLNGMEISQFTYFQQVGGLELKPIMVELTYGLERLAMYVQNVDSVYDIQYNDNYTYGDIFYENEKQFSRYNFEVASVTELKNMYGYHYSEVKKCLNASLILPAYDQLIRCSHLFNLLDSRSAISVQARAIYIQDIRKIALEIANAHLKYRKELGFPLLKKTG